MYYFIVNPASRSGKGQILWDKTIQPALKKRNVEYEVYFSKKPGDLTRLAREIGSKITDKNSHLVIVGGDGTVNETLQGLADLPGVSLSYIPTGSSNDFARDLGFSKKPEQILNHLLDHAEIKKMDVGVLNSAHGTRMFAVSCGIGYDAAVCQEANLSKVKKAFNKIGLGKLTYLGIAIKQLFATKLEACDIYLDDKAPIHIKKLYFVAVMNHRYEGGGFKFCPDANAQDGILDLCVIRNLPKLLVLLALPTGFFGKHYIFPGVDSYKASCIRIVTQKALWVHTDGEIIEKSSDITVTCAPDKINFRY